MYLELINKKINQLQRLVNLTSREKEIYKKKGFHNSYQEAEKKYSKHSKYLNMLQGFIIQKAIREKY